MRALVVALLVLPAAAPVSTTIEIGANGRARTDFPAEVAIDFGALLASAGRSGTFDPATVRVEELTAGGAVSDASVPYQFDPASPGAAKGTLVVLLKGATPATATRRYRVSFDVAGTGAAAPAFPALLTLTDNVTDEGQSAYRIQTPSATWFYHQQGAGFSSLLDKAGKDWLGYKPSGGSAGNYRGIPNAVHPENHFHPGGTGCTSSVASTGPLKISLRSQSTDGKWACTWELFPAWSRLTITKHDHPYWFLYEGTPGGSLEAATDTCLRSDGTKTPLSQSWTGDLAAPEWVAFADGGGPRALFLAHHEDDAATDSFYPMENNMTVFGFGRSGLNKYLTSVPQHFTVGFAEDGSHGAVGALVDAAIRALAVKVNGVAPPPPGGSGGSLNYAFYTGSWSALPDFGLLSPAKTGTAGGFDLSPRTQDDAFGFVFSGYLDVPAGGTWRFFTTSDDGSRLRINGVEVVNNDGLHGAQERSGSIDLPRGEHSIQVEYFDATLGHTLTVAWEGPGIAKGAIPTSALSATGSGGGGGGGCCPAPPPDAEAAGGACGSLGVDLLLLPLLAALLNSRMVGRPSSPIRVE
jgi:hypothetical protein